MPFPPLSGNSLETYAFDVLLCLYMIATKSSYSNNVGNNTAIISIPYWNMQGAISVSRTHRIRLAKLLNRGYLEEHKDGIIMTHFCARSE